MRILHVTPAYKPAHRFGGPSVSVPAVLEALAKQGHHVTVFTTNCDVDRDLDVPVDRALDVEGVEVWYFRRLEPFRNWRFLPYLSQSAGYMFAPRLLRELERVVPTVDVVHVHLPFVYPTWAAAHVAARHSKPLVYQQHGVLDPRHLRFRALKKRVYLATVERRILARAAALVALTPVEAESYRAAGARSDCFLIGNGIDTGAYRQQPRRGALQRWQLPHDAFVILFLGRLRPNKGVALLVDAWLDVVARRRRVVLVVAGPDEVGMRSGLEARISRAGRTADAVFTGLVVGEEKLDLLARADLFCLPSAGEGMSMATLEALASGTPVLLSPECHLPEVEAAGAGRIVPAERDALAHALGELVDDEAALAQMAENARTLARQRFDVARVADELVRVYATTIERYEAR